MRMVIDHDNCQHGGAFADRCLGATVRSKVAGNPAQVHPIDVHPHGLQASRFWVTLPRRVGRVFAPTVPASVA